VLFFNERIFTVKMSEIVRSGQGRGDFENLIIWKTNGKIAQGYLFKLCTDCSGFLVN
jgi:hypothetical protein